jgi:hypothetical protein
MGLGRDLDAPGEGVDRGDASLEAPREVGLGGPVHQLVQGFARVADSRRRPLGPGVGRGREERTGPGPQGNQDGARILPRVPPWKQHQHHPGREQRDEEEVAGARAPGQGPSNLKDTFSFAR